MASTPMVNVLLLALAVACSGGEQPKAPEPPVAVAPRDAAPMTWRGPNLYTLIDGDVTIAVALKPPGTWTEDAADDHELLTSPAGSTMKVTIVRGDPPPDFTESRPGVYQRGSGTSGVWLHTVTFPAGRWFARCEVAIVAADAALYPELARQCEELPLQQEPDPRIAWTLEVRPARVKLGAIGTVTVRYTATNRSNAPINAKAYNLEYWIDGESSMTLGMAFGSGGFESTWMALPPGKTVDDERVGMDDLVSTAGAHVFSLRHLDHEVAGATLHVTK